uniref:Uncharacterized protein n=1 Tax=Meloidogyne incognita TaxID=6306 RepID=A0A914L6Q6_MELIC
MIDIVLENRDRLAQVWPLVRDHLQWLLSPDFAQNKQITERSIIALIRIANRNLFRLGHPQQNVKTPLSPPPLPSAPRTALTKSVVIVVEDEQTQQENGNVRRKGDPAGWMVAQLVVLRSGLIPCWFYSISHAMNFPQHVRARI